MVKPRYEEASSEAYELLRKALELEDRIEKAQPGFATSFDTKPGGVDFMAESGGQTRNVFYNTNQNTLDSDDVANKGASSESVNLDTLPINTPDASVQYRLVEG